MTGKATAVRRRGRWHWAADGLTLLTVIGVLVAGVSMGGSGHPARTGDRGASVTITIRLAHAQPAPIHDRRPSPMITAPSQPDSP